MKITDSTYRTQSSVTEVLQGEGREKEAKSLLKEVVTKNSPNLRKETDIQIQESHIIPNNKNLKRHTPGHIIKLSKVKDERILKVARKNNL